MDRTFRSFLSFDRLILDDLGLHSLAPRRPTGIHELSISRHRVSDFPITSNRAIYQRLPPHRRLLGYRKVKEGLQH